MEQTSWQYSVQTFGVDHLLEVLSMRKKMIQHMQEEIDFKYRLMAIHQEQLADVEAELIRRNVNPITWGGDEK